MNSKCLHIHPITRTSAAMYITAQTACISISDSLSASVAHPWPCSGSYSPLMHLILLPMSGPFGMYFLSTSSQNNVLTPLPYTHTHHRHCTDHQRFTMHMHLIRCRSVINTGNQPPLALFSDSIAPQTIQNTTTAARPVKCL